MTASATPSFPILQPDAQMIRRFSEIVFGYCEGYVAVRMLREKGQTAEKPWTDTLPADSALAGALARLAERAAADHRALFVVPGTLVSPGPATTDAIAETAVILVDLDAGDIAAKRAHLEQHLGTPTLVVASGGITDQGQHKLHLYWRLTEAARDADLARVHDLRDRIALKAGGDPSVARLHQPIRVAGSLHQKHGRRALCRILGQNDRDFDLEDLAIAVATMPAFETASPQDEPGFRIDTEPRAVDLATQVVRENGADGITRFDALSKVIGHWIRQVRLGRTNLAEAFEAVLEHNAAMIAPPWPEDRLRRDFDRLLARDIAHKGPMPEVAVPDGSQGADEHSAPPARSEDALAAIFVHAHGDDWRYVANWGRWLRWTGTHWAEDDRGLVREEVRQVCRAAAIRCEKDGEARRLASDRTIRAVTAIATADRMLATSPGDWDRHPDLLNTQAGILDLTSGEVFPHARRRLLTQITGTSPDTGCPLWRRFLDDITGSDPELVAYLQRLAGYCLTGSTQEHVFFFLHGHGANGKSVFLNTLAAILGCYSRTAPAETFMASRSQGHPTDLAGLRGARLVLVTETEANRAWAESRIKAITGGDPISARFMHRDFFEFVPTFKLLVAGNHRPRLTGVGEAMRRRLHIIPFDVTVPPSRRDKHLGEKLKAEHGGILGWMIEGCAEWRRIGLAPPAKVLAAADDYFADEDVVGQWISERCVTGPEFSVASSALFASWSAFADAGGLEKGSIKALGEALAARGFKSGRTSHSRHWRGISLRGAGGGS